MQPLRRRPRQARSRALVDAIVDAAARILARDGRESLTTNRVADDAGVSVGSLYQYFPNRESIIDAVADRHSARVSAVMTPPDTASPATLDEAIARIVGDVFAAHRVDPKLHCAIEGDLANIHGHVCTRAAVRVQLAALPPDLRTEVRAPDADCAALLVSEIAHALAHVALVRPAPGEAADTLEAETLEHEAVRAALAYLRAE